LIDVKIVMSRHIKDNNSTKEALIDKPQHVFRPFYVLIDIPQKLSGYEKNFLIYTLLRLL